MTTSVPPEKEPFRFLRGNRVNFTDREPSFRTAMKVLYDWRGSYFNRLPQFSISINIVRVGSAADSKTTVGSTLRDLIADSMAAQTPEWGNLKKAEVQEHVVDGWTRLGTARSWGSGGFARMCADGVALFVWPHFGPWIVEDPKAVAARGAIVRAIVERTQCHRDTLR